MIWILSGLLIDDKRLKILGLRRTWVPSCEGYAEPAVTVPGHDTSQHSKLLSEESAAISSPPPPPRCHLVAKQSKQYAYLLRTTNRCSRAQPCLPQGVNVSVVMLIVPIHPLISLFRVSWDNYM